MSTSRGHMGLHSGKEEKAENVKLFVGQISPTMDERALMAFLSEYAPILCVKILYHKKTKQHRHCAFVYVESKDVANVLIQSLNHNFTFEDMRAPVNIAIANPERRNKGVGGEKKDVHDRKFTTSSKKASITPMKSSTAKHSASVELRSYSPLYDSYNDSNSPFPIIVDSNPNPMKYGVSHKSAVGRNDKMTETMMHPSVDGNFITQENATLFDGHISVKSLDIQELPTCTIQQATADTAEFVSEQPILSTSSPFTFLSPPSSDPHSYASPTNPPSSSPSSSSFPMPYCIPSPYYYPDMMYSSMTIPTPTSTPETTQLGTINAAASSPTTTFPGMLTASPSGMMVPVILNNTVYSIPVVIPQQVSPMSGIKTVSDVSGFHQEGPSGANVFVYHIPSDMDDEGLQKLFSPFGIILSTKVYRDKATKESRGFGFVSFSTVVEAEKAIQQMNGYLINGKHLKVQKKKEKFIQPATFPVYSYSG